MNQAVVQLFVNGLAGSLSYRRIEALRRALEDAGARVIESPSGGDPLRVRDRAHDLGEQIVVIGFAHHAVRDVQVLPTIIVEIRS